jgi:hypothetical protein
VILCAGLRLRHESVQPPHHSADFRAAGHTAVGLGTQGESATKDA